MLMASFTPARPFWVGHEFCLLHGPPPVSSSQQISTNRLANTRVSWNPAESLPARAMKAELEGAGLVQPRCTQRTGSPTSGCLVAQLM